MKLEFWFLSIFTALVLAAGLARADDTQAKGGEGSAQLDHTYNLLCGAATIENDYGAFTCRLK